MLRSLMFAAVALTAAPLGAQTNPADQPSRPLPYDLGRDNDSARSDAIAAESAPGVAAANRAALADADASGAQVAADQARYAADVAAYRAALRDNARDTEVHAQRERAYALAMEDWRAQVRACDRGNRRACDAPAPNPADYR